MEWLGIVLAGAALVAAAVIVYRKSRKRSDLWLPLWSAVAERRGGVVRGHDHADVDVGGVEVVVPASMPSQCDACVLVDVIPGGSGRQAASTRARASFPVSGRARFTLSPRGSSSHHGEAPEGQGVRIIGPDAFGRTFHLATDDEDSMGLIWSSRAQKIMVERFANGVVRSDGDVVELRNPGPPSQEVVEAALDLLAELVSIDEWGGLVTATLPEGRYTPAGGEFGKRSVPTVTVDALVPVTLSPVARDGKVFMQAAAESSESAPDLAVFVDEAGKIDERKGSLPDGAAAAAAATGGGTLLRVGGNTLFTWAEDECECADDWLKAGIMLVALVAAGETRAAYR